MLQSLTNMDRVFRLNRIVTIASIVAVTVVSLYALHYVHKTQQEQASVVYALMGDNAVSLRAVDVLENRPVEARNHIELFHKRFFELDPDREVIDRNLGAALSMADRSAQLLVDKYEEDSYYRNLISSNISQSVATDSVHLDMSGYPYYFRYTGKLTITRSTSIVTRSLVADGYFRNVQRSQINPHGFLIENYRLLDNSDLKVERRLARK